MDHDGLHLLQRRLQPARHVRGAQKFGDEAVFLISPTSEYDDKPNEKDAVLIARLTAQLRCYILEPVDETWGRLRHLGTRREQLIVDMTSQIQQIRALLECVWPAALDSACQPFRSRTWAAAISVVCDRDHGELTRTRRLGPARFEVQARIRRQARLQDESALSVRCVLTEAVLRIQVGGRGQRVRTSRVKLLVSAGG
jgi:hypothetical protein